MQIRNGKEAIVTTQPVSDPLHAEHSAQEPAPTMRTRVATLAAPLFPQHAPPAPLKQTVQPEYGGSKAAASPPHKGTEAIKEKILRYYIDPNLQIQELLQTVEQFYLSDACPAELKTAFDDVKAAISTGIIPAERNAASDKPFLRLLGALAGIQNKLEKVFNIPYSDSRIYTTDQKHLVEIAQCVCAAISPQLLLGDEKLSAQDHASTKAAISLMMEFEYIGRELIETASQCTSNESRKQAFCDASPPEPAHPYQTEHFFPVVLNQAFSYEAGLYSFSQGFSLLTVARSERGVHGGSYNEPLVIFLHDTVHFALFFTNRGKDDAAKLRGLANILYKLITESDHLKKDKERYFLMAHLLFHESDPNGLGQLGKFIANPKEVFDYLYGKYDQQVQSPLDLNVGSGSIHLNNVYIDIFKRLNKDTSNYEAWNHKIRENHKKLTDGSFLRGTPFAYDPISAILTLKSKEERDLLHEGLFPGYLPQKLPCFREKISELRKEHKLSETAPPTNSYLRELFLWKANSYNAYAGYQIIRDFMSESKEKVYPQICEQASIDTSNYVDHLTAGKNTG